MSRIDVSIVVIAFNEANNVRECLGALLRQETARDVEIIVVDDASTDGTASIVREMMLAHPQVRLLEHERNRGRGAARRTGQDAAGAPLIGFVDGDVLVPPHWIDTCADVLADHSAVSGIASPDGDCVVLARMVAPTIRIRHHTMPISGGNVMFRSDALAATGFDAEARLGEDFRLARSMAAKGMPLATLPHLVSEHREHKTYGATIRWMWQNGVDAARLPFIFRIFRVPDAAWLLWVLAAIAAIVGGALGAVPWFIVPIAIVVATVVVTVGHMVSRFTPSPRTGRWIVATALDVPLIAAYLIGRSVGFLPALFGPHHRST